MKEIPYITSNWAIYYKGPLHFLVKLKRDTPVIRNEVIEWIKMKGIDPTTHKITWKLEG